MASVTTPTSAPLPAFVAEHRGLSVRVYPNFLKTVVFLGLEDQGRFNPIGTGFIVSLGADDDQHAAHFMVTATHILERVNDFSVRVNRHDGGSGTIRLSTTRMIQHPDPDNDIAIFAFPADPTIYDFMEVRLTRQIIDNLRTEAWDIAAGDEVHAIGLYTSHAGNAKNIPVVRSGNVAALRDEKVLALNQRYVDGYLIELRTIAGLSGSPVFLMPASIRRNDVGELEYVRIPPTVPLGILIGYHLVASADDQIVVPRHPGVGASANADDFTLDERNTGFGIVIPFERVLDALDIKPIWTAVNAAVAKHKERATSKPT